MIPNLQKAARDRETVMIGGGEFDRDELMLAAHMLDCYPELVEALQRVADYWAGGDVPVDLDAQMRAALTKAQQHPARGFA